MDKPDIVYEDDNIIVCNKKPVSHRSLNVLLPMTLRACL